MEQRKKIILSAIIREYVDTAMPVSSSTLVKKYNFDLSGATLRNEMVILEKEGYIFQPHTSAGRIPTDKGYRFFVDELMKRKSLSEKEQSNLYQEFLKLKAKYNQLARITAKLLSSMSHNLVVSGLLDDKSEEACDCGIAELLKEPEFRETDEICKIASILDHLDENIKKISQEVKKEKVKIYIGQENPIIKMDNCSMIVSGFRLSSGDRGLIVIIGPKRMRYAKNVSLVDHLTKLLASGSLVLLIAFSINHVSTRF